MEYWETRKRTSLGKTRSGRTKRFARRRRRQITEAPQIASETQKNDSPHSDSHRPLLPGLLPLLSRSVSNRFGSIRRSSPIIEAYRFN